MRVATKSNSTTVLEWRTRHTGCRPSRPWGVSGINAGKSDRSHGRNRSKAICVLLPNRTVQLCWNGERDTRGVALPDLGASVASTRASQIGATDEIGLKRYACCYQIEQYNCVGMANATHGVSPFQTLGRQWHQRGQVRSEPRTKSV